MSTRRTIQKTLPVDKEPSRYFYRSGKRYFKGTGRDVAKYAFRDQLFQWFMAAAVIAVIIICLIRNTALPIIAILSATKRWISG